METLLLHSAPDCRSIIELFGVDVATRELIGNNLPPGTALRLHNIEGDQLPQATVSSETDVILLGLNLEYPVRLAQRIHAVDRHLPILILAHAARNDQLRRTLMFSPFLGCEVKVWSVDDIEELPAAIAEAAIRRRQRRRYHETVANADIRLEFLPMLQPDATHYLDQLLEHLPIGVVTIDLAGTILTLNNQARLVLGVDERSALGAAFVEFFPESEKARLCALIRGCKEPGKLPRPEIFGIDTLSRGRRKSYVLEITAAALAYRTGQRGVMLMLQDVTAQIEVERDRKRAEEELRIHATVLRAFHEISSTSGQDLKHKVRRLLQLGREQFGMPTGMVTRVDGESLVVVDSVTDDPRFSAGARLPLIQTFCSAAIESVEPIAVEHAKISNWQKHPSYSAGEALRVEAYLGTRVQVNGVVFGTLCFSSRKPCEKPFGTAACDILKLMSQWLGSELQREYAEAGMRKLSGAVEQTADSVIIMNRDLITEYVNASFERMTGYAKSEVVGSKFHQPGRNDVKFNRSLRRKLKTDGVFQGTLTGRKKDGTIFHEQKTISPLKDREGKTTHYIATGRDITELIKVQENDRLRQAELAHVARLSTLGEMTSSLAHELNQPLCAITTYAQTCLRIIQSGDGHSEELRYGLDKIVAQAELGGKIFKRLRDFARKGNSDCQLVNITDIINEVVGFIAWETQHKLIRVKLDLARALPQVRVDPIQIEQVLLNLFRNSIDAVADLEDARRHITVRSFGEKGNIAVVINDGGRGCMRSQVDRLFEPFFTTKTEGLGIGLTVSQSLIEAHGGRLWLKANSRRGATFCFTLPTSEAMA